MPTSTEASIQAYLNSLSQVPGAILYRDALRWYALNPSLQGDVLALDSELRPEWITRSLYYPGLQQFNGSNGKYEKTYTASGNRIAACFRFQTGQFSGATVATFLHATNSTGIRRFAIYQYSNDHSSVNARNRFQVTAVNSANALVCRLYTPKDAFLDGLSHTLFFKYNGDTGQAVFTIDREPQDDTSNPLRIAPVTATLPGGANSVFRVANDASAVYNGARFGYIGYHDSYTAVETSFQNENLTPKNINPTLGTVWGATPLFWHESGQMNQNRGSAGNMTLTGGVTLADANTWS